tara:strand:+ start:465 stop:785 length:321 start_codon:yes stop_codon:yes gene_type:complete
MNKKDEQSDRIFTYITLVVVPFIFINKIFFNTNIRNDDLWDWFLLSSLGAVCIFQGILLFRNSRKLNERQRKIIESIETFGKAVENEFPTIFCVVGGIYLFIRYVF